MATINLGNIRGDQGFQGRETIVIFRPITIGDPAPDIPTGGSVAADGTITAPTDWFNPADLVFDVTTQDLYSTVITWNPATDPAPYTFLTWDVVIRDNGRTGADSIAPTIQIDEQPAGAAGSDPVFAEAAGSTEQARVYDITLSTGATGEQGIPGPAGSASIFLTENVAIPMRTTRVGAGDVGLTPPQYKVYTDAHGSTNGFARFYSGGAVTGNAWISGGAAMIDTTVPASMVLSTFDNNGVAWTPTTGDTYVFTNPTGGVFTIELGAEVTTGLPDATVFANIGLTAWRTVTTTFTGVDASVDVGELNTINITVATAGQTFAQGAFTLDVLPANADLYIKRSAGTVTTAADEASLPANNTTDFQIINLP